METALEMVAVWYVRETAMAWACGYGLMGCLTVLWLMTEKERGDGWVVGICGVIWPVVWVIVALMLAGRFWRWATKPRPWTCAQCGWRNPAENNECCGFCHPVAAKSPAFRPGDRVYVENLGKVGEVREGAAMPGETRFLKIAMGDGSACARTSQQLVPFQKWLGTADFEFRIKSRVVSSRDFYAGRIVAGSVMELCAEGDPAKYAVLMDGGRERVFAEDELMSEEAACLCGTDRHLMGCHADVVDGRLAYDVGVRPSGKIDLTWGHRGKDWSVSLGEGWRVVECSVDESERRDVPRNETLKTVRMEMTIRAEDLHFKTAPVARPQIWHEILIPNGDLYTDDFGDPDFDVSGIHHGTPGTDCAPYAGSRPDPMRAPATIQDVENLREAVRKLKRKVADLQLSVGTDLDGRAPHDLAKRTADLRDRLKKVESVSHEQGVLATPEELAARRGKSELINFMNRSNGKSTFC